MKTMQTQIETANLAQIDGLWAILKYKEIGIMRKLMAMCEVLSISFDSVKDSLPQDENGRILDFETRKQIHEYLISHNHKALNNIN